MEETLEKPAKNQLGWTMLYLAGLYAAWILSWLLSTLLERRGILPATQLVRVIYWTVLRALLWFLPSWALLRRNGRKLSEVLSLKRLKSILLWGGVAGLLIGGSAFLSRVVRGLPLISVDWNWSLLTAVLIGPVVEEITFRGTVLDALQTRMRFWLSNLITGVLFLLIHLPGWYFQGLLAQHLMLPMGGALSILLLGWIFGYVAHRSRSVSGSILTHMLNNLFAAL
jgi:membrane protease YdiL (CAAX protease family)